VTKFERRLVTVAVLLLGVITGRFLAAESAGKDRGQELFLRRCRGCHGLDEDMEGPRLRNVYGRVAGSVASFEYSAALRKSAITWNADSLEKWLASPDRLVPGNDMSFYVERPEERAAIIEYLKGIAGK
jgi:cytochrome c